MDSNKENIIKEHFNDLAIPEMENAKERSWDKLEINQSKPKRIWPWIVALLVLLLSLLSLLFNSKPAKENLHATEQENKELEKEISHETSLNNQIANLQQELRSVKLALSDSLESLKAKMVLEVLNPEKFRIDTIYIQKEAEIVYKQKIIYDTIFVERVPQAHELPILQELEEDTLLAEVEISKKKSISPRSIMIDLPSKRRTKRKKSSFILTTIKKYEEPSESIIKTTINQKL